MFDRTVKGMLRSRDGLELHIPPYPQHLKGQESPGDALLSGMPTRCYGRYHPFQDYQNH
jgi:hypothetical protein